MAFSGNIFTAPDGSQYLYTGTTPNNMYGQLDIERRKTERFFDVPAQRQRMLNNGVLVPMSGGGIGNAQMSQPQSARAKFTPNAYTQGQLAGMGGGSVPQWMMNMYSNKIGQMGGNANNPPFSVTQSGFPGVGGKSAPTQGQ